MDHNHALEALIEGVAVVRLLNTLSPLSPPPTASCCAPSCPPQLGQSDTAAVSPVNGIHQVVRLVKDHGVAGQHHTQRVPAANRGGEGAMCVCGGGTVGGLICLKVVVGQQDHLQGIPAARGGGMQDKVVLQ